ncbi:MAG: hypothetical protein H7Z43_03450 [Clostridia bacterium]|nr:hypothetical protein [Deltaproteobacteria bacterium]
MSALADLLKNTVKRNAIVDDCARLVDEEVAAKGGLSGIAIKGGYAVIKALKPGIIRDACDHLVDEFVGKLDPYWADFKTTGGKTFESFLTPKKNQVANALLEVTDGKARNAKNPTIKKVYDKLRPTGVKNVEVAVPGIARVIEKNA